MNQMPPKQMPDEQPRHFTAEPGNMLATYSAQSSSDSFPVLKAFQDYIEAERAQARKRVVQLSTLFVILLVLVVSGFLTAGIFVLHNMSNMQNKLLDVVAATRETPQPVVSAPPTPPIVVQNSPQIEESLRTMTKTAAEMQSAIDKKMDGVSEIATRMHEQAKAQDAELKTLREELKRTQEQSVQLNQELAKLKAPPVATPQRTATAKPVTPVPAQPQKTQVVPPTPPPATALANQPQPAPIPTPAVAPTATVPTTPPAATAAQPQELPINTPPVVAAAAQPAPAQAKIVLDPRFPPPVKEPPVVADNIKAPPPPPGRMATAIPLKTRNIGTLPWRVLIPD